MVTIDDIRHAALRIGPTAHRTPVLTSRLLSEACGGRVFLKAENLQVAGAFKFRGALNAVRQLDDEARRRGVITYSSGNHGQALARAAQLEGVKAVIFMPEDTPQPKVDAACGYGAEVRRAGLTSTERKLAAEAAAANEGFVIIPPFDHPHIVAGQGTVGLEIVEQVPDLEVVITPVGGGGLIAGIGVVLAAERPAARLVGVEAEAAPALSLAIERGAPVTIEPGSTLADGLKPVRVGELPFRIVAGRFAAGALGVELVDETSLRDAVRFLVTRARLIVEPSGAAGVAAILSGRLDLRGRTVVVVLSGGNVSTEVLAAILSDDG